MYAMYAIYLLWHSGTVMTASATFRDDAPPSKWQCDSTTNDGRTPGLPGMSILEYIRVLVLCYNIVRGGRGRRREREKKGEKRRIE